MCSVPTAGLLAQLSLCGFSAGERILWPSHRRRKEAQAELRRLRPFLYRRGPSSKLSELSANPLGIFKPKFHCLFRMLLLVLNGRRHFVRLPVRVALACRRQHSFQRHRRRADNVSSSTGLITRNHASRWSMWLFTRKAARPDTFEARMQRAKSEGFACGSQEGKLSCSGSPLNGLATPGTDFTDG